MVISLVMVTILLNKRLNIEWTSACSGLLTRFGTHMAVYIGVLSAAQFCFLMITCGSDTTFKFEWIH